MEKTSILKDFYKLLMERSEKQLSLNKMANQKVVIDSVKSFLAIDTKILN